MRRDKSSSIARPSRVTRPVPGRLIAAAAIVLAVSAGCGEERSTYWSAARVEAAETSLDALLMGVSTTLGATVERVPTYRITSCGDGLSGSTSVVGTAILHVPGGWLPLVTNPLYPELKELGLPVVRPHDDGFDASSNELNLHGSFRDGELILGLGTACHQ